MSKQLLNRVLIIFLLLIWSIVGYKLISSFFGKKQVMVKDPVVVNQNLEKDTKKRDLFILPTITRDPFLGNYTFSKKEISPTRIPNKTIKNLKILWPHIEYYGFVRSENSSNPLVLLKINNTMERIRRGSRIDGLTIGAVYSDSILVVFGSEKKMFAKK